MWVLTLANESSVELAVYQIALVALLGLIAGTLGGMLGVGGSIIMIPGLVMLFGQNDQPGLNQHLYQAAAMIANVAVAVPAARRHQRAGRMNKPVLISMLPAALVFIIVGVWLSNLSFFSEADGPVWLGRLLAALMVYVIWVNIRKLRQPPTEKMADAESSGEATEQPVSFLRGSMVGAMMGLIAGLLGVGGGAIAVPMQQILLKLPLRNCIANSAAVMCVSATLGASYKNATLAGHGLEWQTSVLLAALLAPTCIVGGYLGASLTHRLPNRHVRIAFILLIAVAAVKMAKLS